MFYNRLKAAQAEIKSSVVVVVATTEISIKGSEAKATPQADVKCLPRKGLPPIYLFLCDDSLLRSWRRINWHCSFQHLSLDKRLLGNQNGRTLTNDVKSELCDAAAATEKAFSLVKIKQSQATACESGNSSSGLWRQSHISYKVRGGPGIHRKSLNLEVMLQDLSFLEEHWFFFFSLFWPNSRNFSHNTFLNNAILWPAF